jgi:ABC-type thiamin/hydroxymethylpyrimidine transport system permease subunit
LTLQNQKPRNNNLKVATVDLVLMAMFASLGLATKNLLYPILGPLIGAVDVPTGGVIGGLYMMWPVMAYGLTRKPGTATMVSLIQACISLILPYGNFGLLSFIIYLGPGLAIDGFFLIIRHKACCLGCCMIASALANAVGTTLVASLVLVLPTVVLTFLAVIAGISGCIGGVMANLILVRIDKIGVWKTRE